MPPKRRWNSSEKRTVAHRQAWRCARCATLLPATYEVDHVHPLHRGGADCLETNAEALCNSCHSRKTLDERLVMERERTEAILKAKAGEGITSLTTQPLRGNRPLLAPEPGIEFLQNRFLKYAHVRANHGRV